METFRKRFERQIKAIKYYCGPSEYNKKLLEEKIKKNEIIRLYGLEAERHRRIHFPIFPSPRKKNYSANKFIDAYV